MELNFGTFQQELLNHATQLFKQGVVVQLNSNPDTVWSIYLNSFPEGTNPMFRERTEHDCNCCRHFLQRFGNLAVIHKDTYKLETLWEGLKPSQAAYAGVVRALRHHFKGLSPERVLRTAEDVMGTEKTVKALDDGSVEAWNHLFIPTPAGYQVEKRYMGPTIDRLRASCQTAERALTEITSDAVAITLDLISQDSLYRGEQYAPAVRALDKAQRQVSQGVSPKLWAMYNAQTGNLHVANIRNSAIGTLLVDLSEGLPLEEAVRKYEAVTAPANYRRTKALVTPTMIAQAKEELEGLGLMDALPHRFASLHDVSVNNVLFADREVKRVMQGGPVDVFEQLTQESKPKMDPAKLENVEEIPWRKFVKDVLPRAESIDLIYEGKHTNNLVSLLAPVNPDAQKLMSWNNNFCWAYKGNVTDSMKERVKAAGGKVDGDLRFSIQWNDDHGRNLSDLDAHCRCPSGREIYFSSMSDPTSGGKLDVDITSPGSQVAVENITWARKAGMDTGSYKFMVNMYARRTGAETGFSAEIEFDGKIYSFSQRNAHSGKLDIATVHLRDGQFSITPSLPMTDGVGQGAWDLVPGDLVPVHAVMYSPNYWDEQKGSGNRHLMFMLKGCKSDETPNAFFNEFMRGDLRPHRKLLELVGTRMAVTENDDQLSGLGFCTTKRNRVLLRVKGGIDRPIAVKF